MEGESTLHPIKRQQNGGNMKAFVLHNIGDLQLEEVKKPELKEREVLVEVRAAGICGSDIPRIYRTGAYSHPLIPGHEFSGVVTEVRDDMDRQWIGKRVGIFPLIPCGSCPPCEKKQYEMCRHYGYLGSRRDGGFAEFAAVPVDNLLVLPDTVTFPEAAMLEPMAVAVHAMRRVDLDPAGWIVVCGLGTIGLLLIMFLMDRGCRKILAIGNKESQKQAVLKLGLGEDCYCDARKQDMGRWVLEKTGIGTAVFFECVGKNETIAFGVEYTAPGGQVMLMGNPYSDMKLDKAVYWKILRNQLTVTGTWNSSFHYGRNTKRGSEAEGLDDWQYVLERLAKRRISPADLISHQFPFEKLEQGFQIMRDKSEDYIKIMGIR